MRCVFCEIASGTVPVETVTETSQYVAFPDREPRAPTHILIVPKTHIDGINEAIKSHTELLGRLLLAAGDVARLLKIDNEGYRLVINEGEAGGQSIRHLHIHLLGGRRLNWPPG